ncbi:class I SAM-dependent methyltransferase [Streptomyces sp. NPDC048603]|uniref:class I SAM-dependent methyltransferase n=1 Tax=Streptomyces sp. NPDC048603 TaxID=3365577 RepID=UPI003715F1D4
MDADSSSWAWGRPQTSPFAHPQGLRGRLAGRFMLWTNQQDEVLDALNVQPGDRVLEVGYGPGGLLGLLACSTAAAAVLGVDPSPTMRSAAARANRAAVRSGRITLGLGTAEHTGLADRSVDRIASVNNVGLWPDLEAGVRELHRVLRPGGTVLIAWHGGSSPRRLERRLRLPQDRLARIEGALRHRFTDVTRRELSRLDVFTAVR